MLKYLNFINNKEFFILFYFLLFILGFTVGISPNFYNEFRVLEIAILLGFGLYSLYSNQYLFFKKELLFLMFIAIGSFFWQYYQFIVVDLLLAYLFYKNFHFLNYNNLVTKTIVLASFLIFLLLPISLWSYVVTGSYSPIWYPMPWNIRVYDSYFLILSIFAVWLYLTEQKYKNIYLVFLLLAFCSILLNGGRSVTLAYSVFIIIVSIFHRNARWRLIGVYSLSWLTYIVITYTANLNIASLRIARESSSGRFDLWTNAFQSWLQHPILGSGFYQLSDYSNLSAHPHNLFIQVLTETGLIGFGFLTYTVFKIVRNINWNLRKGYFVIATLLAVSIDLSLSGIHIYPITQMALLWLFVFLLKNPSFSHSQYFNQKIINKSLKIKYLSIIIYINLITIFLYIFIKTTALSEALPLSPPRFWEYGFQLL